MIKSKFEEAVEAILESTFEDNWTELISKFEGILAKAQAKRSEKGDWVGDELEWQVYEREVMLDAVNLERKELGRPSVTMSDIKSADSHAAGHSDYPHKFALYCAELV